jgi:phage terminase large subunit-like protein
MTRDEYRRSLKGRRCYVGMDLSSTKDLTALVAVFPDDDGFDVLAQFFVPQESIRERSNRDRVPYDQWAREGHLIATPGNVVDYEYIRQNLNDWAAEFQVREVAYDPWNATDLVTRLQEQDGFVCVPMRQGFPTLSAPTKSLEKAILSKALRHDGHPVMRWCVSNVSVDIVGGKAHSESLDDAANIKPSKTKSTEKIDGVIALVMAIDRMDANQGVQPKVYQLMVLGGARA